MPKCILASSRVLVGFVAGMVTCGGWLARAQGPLILFEGKIRTGDGAALAGVAVRYSNGSASVTDRTGHYFTVIPAGFSGSSAPQLDGYTFSATSRSYVKVAADQLNQDFTAVQPTYTVSGNAAGIGGMLLTFSTGQHAISEPGGFYSAQIPAGRAGTVTARRNTWAFTPDSVPYSPEMASDRDFYFLRPGNPQPLREPDFTEQSPCSSNDASEAFEAESTRRIYACLWATVAPGDRVEFNWYDPSGYLRRQTFETFNYYANTAGVTWIDIDDEIAAHPGTWLVEAHRPPRFYYTTPTSNTFVLFSDRAASLPRTSSFAHLAAGGDWETSIVLVNMADSATEARLDFTADDGSPLALQFSVIPAGSRLFASSANLPLGPRSVLMLRSTAPETAPVAVGSAQLTAGPSVDGFLLFRSKGNGQEALVPLLKSAARSYKLPFDHTGGLLTGVAMANAGAQSASIPVVIRDDSGAVMRSDRIGLPARGHTSFLLPSKFGVTTGRRGTIDFNAPDGAMISVLGLRFAPSGAFTSIPVFADDDPGGGAAVHIASGGGWKTSIQLVNLAGGAANPSLGFFGNDGSPLALPLVSPQFGGPTVASEWSGVLGPRSTLLLESSGPDGTPVQVGSAKLTSPRQVSGFTMFQALASGQESIVPLETRKPASFVLPFDQTEGLATGVAVASLGSAASIPVVVRDQTGVQIGLDLISIPARGHTSFVLAERLGFTANRRGTVEFGVPPGREISLLGLRFTPTGAFTTIPIFAP